MLNFEVMNNTIKNAIEAIIPIVLDRDRKKSGYVCLICNSGNGAKGTGMVYNKAKGLFYCNTCNKAYDILAIIGQRYNLTEYKDILIKGYELLGLPLPETDGAITTPKAITPKAEPPITEQEPPKDYSSYYSTLKEVQGNTTYLEGRGINNYIAHTSNVMYDSQKNAIVFIYSNSFYKMRIASSKATFANGRNYNIPSGAKVELYEPSPKNFYKSRENIIVAEGEINCLSLLMSEHYNSIALGSMSNTKLLLEAIKEKRYKALKNLYIVLDADATKHAEELIASIKEIAPEIKAYNIQPFIKGNDTKDKDLNYLLVNYGAEALFDNVEQAIKMAEEQAKEQEKTAEEKELEALKERVQARGMEQNLVAFYDRMNETLEKPTSTGFGQLDLKLSGGLYDGRLYMLGAETGKGKTAITLQIAENIANSGRDVLIFSIEITKEELISRLIAKHTAEIVHDKERYSNFSAKKVEQEYKKKCTEYAFIRQYLNLEEMRQKYILQAFNDVRVSKAFSHLYLEDGIMKLTITDIEKAVREHTQATGNKPVVIVDYLQIIRPEQEYKNRGTKDNIDIIVATLKQLANDGYPVVVISSLNRESYKPGKEFNSVSLNAFKESGGIEFTADIVIGLQDRGLYRASKNSKDMVATSEAQKVKANNEKYFIKQMELVILKNRIGTKGTPINFDFYAPYNYYVENFGGVSNNDNLDTDEPPEMLNGHPRIGIAEIMENATPYRRTKKAPKVIQIPIDEDGVYSVFSGMATDEELIKAFSNMPAEQLTYAKAHTTDKRILGLLNKVKSSIFENL